MKRGLLVGFSAIVVLVAGLPYSGYAGGFKIQDQSTRAMGMIDAFNAGADDASAVYYNPAGLTNLPGRQIIGNAYLAHADIDYSGPGGSDSTDGRVYVLPTGYLAIPLDEELRWFAGLGVYSPFGLGTRWADDSLVANYITLAEIRLVNVNPTLAYRINDYISVGVGVDYYYSRVINRRIGAMSGGEEDMDATGDGWGYNLGLQLHCSETLSFGLTYRSSIAIDHDGDAEFDGLGLSLDVESTVDYPDVVGTGICWQATPKLRLELAADWTNWSTRDVQAIELRVPAGLPIPPVQVTHTDWEDSWVIMLGAEYEVNEKWTVRGGYGYNETPVPGDRAEPSLPTGDTHAVSLGASYRIRENVTIDMAGIVSYSEKNTLSNPAMAPPDSDYESIGTFLSLGVTWDF